MEKRGGINIRLKKTGLERARETQLKWIAGIITNPMTPHLGHWQPRVAAQRRFSAAQHPFSGLWGSIDTSQELSETLTPSIIPKSFALKSALS